jgi:hypothetical protein
MKLLFLIIASRNDLYDKIKEYWQKIIDTKHNNINFYFLYNVPNIEKEYIIAGNDIFFQEKESFIPGIFNKTISALNVCNYNNYDYIIRTNLSTFFYIPQLLRFLQNADPTKIYAPLVKYSERYHYTFPVGLCIIMHKSNVSKIMANLSTIKMKYNATEYNFDSYPDDVLFGIIFKELNMPYDNIIQSSLIRSDEIYTIVPLQTHILRTKFIFRNRDYLFYIDEHGKQQNDIVKRLQHEIPRWELVIKYCI